MFPSFLQTISKIIHKFKKGGRWGWDGGPGYENNFIFINKDVFEHYQKWNKVVFLWSSKKTLQIFQSFQREGYEGGGGGPECNNI